MKATLRKTLRERLERLSFDELIEKSGALTERFQDHLNQWQGRLQNRAIINFYPFGFEPQIQLEPVVPGQTIPFEVGYFRIEDWSQRIMKPRVARRDVPDLWEEFELSTGHRIFQPKSSQSEIQSEQITVILVPGLGYSREGHRLGRGAGFYDRYLSQVPQALRVGIGFEEQIEQQVPTDPHDELLDLILTDQHAYETNRYLSWKNQGRIERK